MGHLMRALWMRRLAWLAGFWLAGVVGLAVVAGLLKFFMRAAGLSG